MKVKVKFLKEQIHKCVWVLFNSAICLACMRKRESNKQYLSVYPKKKMSPYTLDSKCQFYLIFKNLRYRKMSYNFRLEQINSFLTIHILNLFCSQARTPDSFVSWKTALWQIPYWWSSIFIFFLKMLIWIVSFFGKLLCNISVQGLF